MPAQHEDDSSLAGQKRPHERKARTFNVEDMFAQAIAQAPTYTHGETPDSALTSEERVQEALAKVAIPQNNDENRDSDDDDLGPALPPGFVPDKSVIVEDGKQAQNAEEEDDEDGPVTVSQLIPTACEATVKMDQPTPVSALAIDPQGTKFATGNFSYFIYLYEYLKMDSSMKHFRDMMPCESHVINDLAYSNNGERLLVASGESILKLLERNGQQWCETVRGDQYLVDASLTKGHTATVLCCCWNPLVKTEFLTCSADGTIRIWSTDDYKDITKCINTQRSVIKTKNALGKRIIPTKCCYSRDGKLIAGGCDDGSVYIWKHGKIFVNAKYTNRASHKGAITGMAFSPDGKQLVTRSLDNSLKLFNLDSFKQAAYEVNNLENNFAQTDCSYSPRAEFIFTGVSSAEKKNQFSGGLYFFSAENLTLLYKIDYSEAGCIRSVWHPRLNQILVTLSNGTLKNYYDPEMSVRGARLCADKPVRRARASEIVQEELILSPLALEMFQPRGEEGEEKEVTEWRIKKYLRMRDGNQRPQFRKPAEMPISGSSGGRVAKSGGSLHSYIAQQLGTSRNASFLTDKDVRGSILRHAEEAEKNPIYITKAYEKTQPKPIFQKNTQEDDAEEPVHKARKLGQ